MNLAHPDSPVVRDAGAIRSAAMLTCRWSDLALDLDGLALEKRFEQAMQLASLAIARAYFLEHERPSASVTSIERARRARHNRKAAPTPSPRLGA